MTRFAARLNRLQALCALSLLPFKQATASRGPAARRLRTIATAPRRGRGAVCVISCNVYAFDARVKRYVASLLGAGYEVDVFTLGPTGPAAPGLTLYELATKTLSQRPGPTIFAQLRFVLLAGIKAGIAGLRWRYSLVHVHNMPDFPVFAGLVPKLLGAKIILDIHDTAPEAYATKFNLELTRPEIGLVRIEERLSAAFADHVITTNDLHRQTLIGHGIPGPKISVIMNVADSSIFSPRLKVQRNEELTLMYHGTVAKRLGLDLMLKAISSIRGSCPGLRFIILGRGEYLDAVKRMRWEYGLEGCVSLEDMVPVEQLPARLAQADIGVIGNSLDTELHGNWMLPAKLLEWAAMEIPTIVPDLKVIRRYFDDGNVLFYRPDDVDDLAARIRDIYYHPEKLMDFRARLRSFNLQYNWNKMEARYFRLVDSLTGTA